MRILILGDPSSPHIIKWVRGLTNVGIDIYLFGLSKYDQLNYDDISNLRINSLKLSGSIFSSKSFLNKSVYLKAIFEIKKIIKVYKPDILHAHYASSYGFLGALSGFKPFILSVWGTDVYSFPNESKIKKHILKFNLTKATYICSTSHNMAEETNKYTKKNINVVAFGINTDEFKNHQKKLNIFDKDEIVIGTVKTLENKYGIEFLIKAFQQVKTKLNKEKIKLLIVGGGSEREYLENLSKELGIEKETVFTGKINYKEIMDYYNELDIYLALSLEESFGVAVIEASACEKPVIVSNVGGLPEVVDEKNTGFIVNKKDYIKASEYLEKLILDKKLRIEMGKKGRKFVEKNYDFSTNLNQMIEIYNLALKK